MDILELCCIINVLPAMHSKMNTKASRGSNFHAHVLHSLAGSIDRLLELNSLCQNISVATGLVPPLLDAPFTY